MMYQGSQCSLAGTMVFLLLPLAASMTVRRSSGLSAGALSPITVLADLTAPITVFTDMGSSSNDTGPILSLTDMTGTESESLTLGQMGKVFARSQEMHRRSMEAITSSMTQSKAMEVIEKSTVANGPILKQLTGLLSNKQNLRKTIQGQDGFGGLNGARLLLNDMIHEVMIKYDTEIAKCTSYYASQCALMEVARGQISAANYIAATARALIMDSQQMINHCEISIPETKQELQDHNLECRKELKKMNEKLKIILLDVEVLTFILEMSDCDSPKKLMQMKKMTLMKCQDECTNHTSVIFNNNKDIQDRVEMLKSPGAKDLVTNTFVNMFDESDSDDGSDDEEPIQLLRSTNFTVFNDPPAPRTQVPGKPTAKLPVPGAHMKQCGDKCHLRINPRCYKIAAKFLTIQAGIIDSRDYLMDDISKLEAACDETKKTLETSIANDGALLSSSQTKLGTAMEKEASAGETGRQVAKENQQYNDDLIKQMKTCSTNYGDFENELCALKKIRGDLFKKMKPGHPGFFQDCEVSPWSPEACTKVCAGGNQKLSRTVLTHPNGGTKCLPLSAERTCNLGPCAVNCALAEWGGWSKCSAKCGGGMANRVRDVKTPMQYGGKQCGSTSEAKPCNVDACEKDCVLHPWTQWTSCSKHCDGGSKKRERMIFTPVEGSGTCADKWSPLRLEYQPCALHRCKVEDPKSVMKCNKSMDVVLVLDGTPRGGKKMFAAEVTAAKQLVDAWSGDGITAKPGFAVVHFTGPRTWMGVSKCTGMSTKKVDMEKTCKITLVQHFTDDIKKTKSKIDGLTFQPGSKLLSLGLMTVQSEFALGNKNHRTIVVVFIHGQPLSFRKTLLASRAIRKKARLVYVVASKHSPLASIKKWASRRWQENIVVVKGKENMAKLATGTHIIANICPREFPKTQMAPAGELPPLD